MSVRPSKGQLFISLPSEFKEKNEKGIYYPCFSVEKVDMKTGQTVYNPYERKEIEGEVVYAAEELNNYVAKFKYDSKIGGARNNREHLWSISDLGYKMMVKPGDTVWFHYLENNIEDKSRWFFDKERGEYLLMIHQQKLLGYRDSNGQVQALNGKVFIEKVDYPFGTEQVNDIGIITALNKKETGIGKIFATSPWEEEYKDCGLEVGDLILHSKFGKFENEIDGKRVYVMNQDFIAAKVDLVEEAMSYQFTPVGDYVQCSEDKNAEKGIIHIPTRSEAEEIIKRNQVWMYSEMETITGRKAGTMGGAAELKGNRLKKAIGGTNIPLRLRVDKLGKRTQYLKLWDKIELSKSWLNMVVERPEQGTWFVRELDVALIHS